MKKGKSGLVPIIKKTSFLSLLFLLYLSYADIPLYSADLDDIYKPLIKKNRVLYKGEFDYFQLEEDGIHGSALYDEFYSTPRIFTFANALRFALFPFIDVTLGLNEALPSSYKRFTYDPGDVLASVQRYQIDSFEDYNVDVRMRGKPIELRVAFSEKRQKADWRWGPDPNMPPTYFSYIRTHYEELDAEARYLSDPESSKDKSALSQIDRPLMDKDQVNLEAGLGYRAGELNRNSPYYIFNRYYNFRHSLKPHLIPKVVIRYGACEDLELEGGLVYTTPIVYEYDYKQFFSNGTNSITSGVYTIDNNFYAPLAVRARFYDDFEAMLSSDFRFTNQSIDYLKKNPNGTDTLYPSLGMAYFNMQPALRLTYVYDANKQIVKDELSSISKTLLLKNQFLLEGKYLRDITYLNKFLDDGCQNISDPYNVFLYPLDYFVSGTEYATFYAGNTSNFEANVLPQNYHRVNFKFVYGLSDTVNVGLGYGFQSHSTLHHFTLYDLTNRFYKFNAYHFFDPEADWKITKDSMLSFKAHIVPRYLTYMENNGNPKEFREKTKYINMSVALKMLF